MAAEPPAVVAPRASSPWRPFASKPFAILWTATLISHVGTWMHDVAAGWLMTSLAPSAAMVALVQAATTLPVFLFALPAGALADLVDRRRMLVVINGAMTVLTAVLGWLVMREAVGALALLIVTFALGVCTAFIAPAWQAIVPQLVPREQLASAVALNSLGVNVSRAIGPAVGALLIVTFGIAWPFFANALSFIVVILALTAWRRPTPTPSLIEREPFIRAMWAGLRYARSSDPLRATLLRAFIFFSCASAYWALLPLIARIQLQGDAQTYGLLVTSIGAGAIVGALALPRLRGAVGANAVALVGVIATACALLGFALVQTSAAAVVVSALSGASWIAVLSSLNVSTQAVLPDWVRARGLAVYNACFFGAMAVGSIAWGRIAEQWSIRSALMVAAVLAILGAFMSLRWKLREPGDFDLTAARAWSAPNVEPVPTSGSVMTSVEYFVDAASAPDFLRSLDELAKARRRNGAFEWRVLRDLARPERFVEYFLEHSWADHLRHHERMTHDDRALQVRVQQFHRGNRPPLVTHFVAAHSRS